MYKKESQGWRKHLDFILVDLAMLYLAVILAYIARPNWKLAYETDVYFQLAVILTVVDLIAIFVFDPFETVLKRNQYQEFASTCKHIAVVMMMAVFYLFSMKRAEVYSRVYIYLFSGFYLIFGYAGRIIWKELLKERRKSMDGRALLVVTESQRAADVVMNLSQSQGETFRVTGLVLTDGKEDLQEVCKVPVVSDFSGVLSYVCRQWVDEVFVQVAHHSDEIEAMIQGFMEMGVTVHQGIPTSGIGSSKQFIEKLGDYVVFTSSINYASPVQLFMKRLIDIVGGLLGCVITAILYVFLAPRIKKESPGPVFFSQVRIGKNGRKFKIYKFRSMYLDAEERKKELMAQNRMKDGMMFKLEYDPRIIGCKKLEDGTIKRGIGNMIRDLSLDEFPQFYNVLKGEMSLVGTRPPTVDEWEKYELHHRARLATKPGITGMWQVSGRSNITDFEEVVKLDTKYITEWSMGLDLKILGKTVVSVLKREGSM